MAGDEIFLNPVVLRAFRFVEGWLDVSRNELISHRRQARLVRARTLFVVIMHRHTIFSYPEIGRLLGGRDHTTIMHMVKVVAPRLRERDPAFAGLCDRFDPKEHSACTQ